jgi:hypothetical protein
MRQHEEDLPDDVVCVEEGDLDRERHPEGVDGSGALEQECRVRGQGRVPTQPSHPLTSGLGKERSKDQPPRTEQADLTHRRTLAPAADIQGGLRERPDLLNYPN